MRSLISLLVVHADLQDRILARDHTEYVRAERDVLTSVRHPYIVMLHWSFQVSFDETASPKKAEKPPNLVPTSVCHPRHMCVMLRRFLQARCQAPPAWTCANRHRHGNPWLHRHVPYDA